MERTKIVKRIFLNGIAIVAALLVAQSSAFAQNGEIRSRVLDEAGAPIPDVQIELGTTQRRTLSDDDGSFLFPNVPAGSYSVQFRRIGYQLLTLKVDVAARASAAPSVVMVAIPRVLDSVRIFEKQNGLRYTGTVLDERSAPVAGANVIVPGHARELRTDAEGHFSVVGFRTGTVMARVRKVGYVAELHAIQLDRERMDTIRLRRLETNLTPVQVLARSGFGKDSFAYRDLDQRMRWKSEQSYVVSRAEFDKQGTTDLANAIRYSVTGGKYGGTLSHPMPDGCVIINGDHALKDWPLTAFFADEVEAVEVFPPKSDVTGTIEARGCDPKKQTYIIWMRSNSKRFQSEP
ncbi:MAG TPA: carboxypeptidase-like regulatory domain-containing protein [Casimicrobiaceae bacterium]